MSELNIQHCKKCDEVILVDALFCRHCGAKLPKGSSFCPQCGKALTIPKGKISSKNNGNLKKVFAVLYSFYLIIQCIFCVPHTVYAVQVSSQNVPHYIKVDEVIDVLWYKPLASVRADGLPKYTSAINFPVLITEIILVTVIFLLIYFCFRKTKNRDIGIK